MPDNNFGFGNSHISPNIENMQNTLTANIQNQTHNNSPAPDTKSSFAGSINSLQKLILIRRVMLFQVILIILFISAVLYGVGSAETAEQIPEEITYNALGNRYVQKIPTDILPQKVAPIAKEYLSRIIPEKLKKYINK